MHSAKLAQSSNDAVGLDFLLQRSSFFNRLRQRVSFHLQYQVPTPMLLPGEATCQRYCLRQQQNWSYASKPTHFPHSAVLPFLMDDDPSSILVCVQMNSAVFEHNIQSHISHVAVAIFISLQGRTQGGIGVKNPPWAWYFTKTLLPSPRRLIVFAYFLFVGLST